MLSALWLLLVPLLFAANLDEHFEEWRAANRLTRPIEPEQILRPEVILQPYTSDLSFYKQPLEEAVSTLERLSMSHLDIALLFYASLHAKREDMLAVNAAFLIRAIQSWTTKETIEVSVGLFDLPFKTIGKAAEFVLKEKFTRHRLKTGLSLSHFIYECLRLRVGFEFLRSAMGCFDSYHFENIMYDLVGPDRKTIIQIVIEWNLSGMFHHFPELIKGCLGAKRSMYQWNDQPFVPSPLFWINKNTHFGVVTAFCGFPVLFAKFDEGFNSILHHAINQDCDIEIIHLILHVVPTLASIHNLAGEPPLYTAYLKRNYEAMQLLVSMDCNQQIMENCFLINGRTVDIRPEFRILRTVQSVAEEERDHTAIRILTGVTWKSVDSSN